MRSGGHARLTNLVKGLGARHEVFWLSLATTTDSSDSNRIEGLSEDPFLVEARHNQSWRDKVSDALIPAHWRRTLSRLNGRFRGLPREVIQMDFPELAKVLRELLQRVHFDVVQLEYTAMAQYRRIIRICSTRTAVILDEIDVSYLALERRLNVEEAAKKRALKKQFLRMRDYERAQWGEFDAVITMSEEERREVAGGCDPGRVWIVPNGVNTAHFLFQDRTEVAFPRLLFLGNLLHHPNRQGLHRFLREIWPELRRRLPGIKLDVVGEGASEELLQYSCDSVIFHNYVPDVRPFFAVSSLLVVPVWSGAGTRLKVLEAFAAGLPVVSTDLGCQGLKAKAGKHFFRAEDTDHFASTICRLLRQPGIGQTVAAEARKLAEEHFDWQVIVRQADTVWAAACR